MSGGLRRRLAVAAVTVVGLGACAGGAAASGFQLSVTPTKLAPGGKVTISTTPRMACTLTLTIAKRSFKHAMPYGWIQVKMPKRDMPGRVPVKVTCGGQSDSSAFTVR